MNKNVRIRKQYDQNIQDRFNLEVHRLLFLIPIFILLVPVYLNSQGVGDHLFDNSFLHQIYLEAPGLEQIISWDVGYYNDPVKMTIDGTIVDSIYIRRKGFTSNEFNDVNPPFKLDLDSFVVNKEFNGIDKFNLHNHYLDEYFQRNALAYALYRRAGAIAPRTSFTEVYINGNFIAIYTITEDIDKTFLKQKFSSDKGSLYKGVEFPVNGVEVQQGTIDAYNNYINNAAANNIETIVDLHNYFRTLAVDLIIKDWDSYALGSHNFYLYQEPKSEKLHYITWDHNFSFSTLTTDNFLYPQRMLENGIITDPVIKPIYLQTMCDLISYLINEDFIEDLAVHNYNVMNMNSNNVIILSPMPLIDFIATQREWFRTKLLEEGYGNCDALTLPVKIGDIVINEFVAKSGIGGVKDPNGSIEDWIELYNTTDSDIILDEKFYLSDDKEFLKRWHFEEDVIIPANGYLIIWADRDIDQQEIHTNFKLNSNGGYLFLTYEDLTELQRIHYMSQILNQGYARVPNGTGDFQIQAHTFNADNDIPLSVSSSKNTVEYKIEIYPNPSSGKINIMNFHYLKGSEIKLFNSIGQIVPFSNTNGVLNIGGLPSGIYFLSLIQKNKQKSYKLIIN